LKFEKLKVPDFNSAKHASAINDELLVGIGFDSVQIALVFHATEYGCNL
jgi:hypothetical protein